MVLLLFAAPASASTPRSVRVGIYANKPKIFWDASQGRASGIFIDILEVIAAREGWTLEYVPGSWSQGLERLESGGIDLMPDVAHSPERALRFDFHQHLVVVSWSQVYARKGLSLERWSDLKGRRVALLEDSIQQNMILQMTQGNSDGPKLLGVGSFEEAFALARSGATDAVVANVFYGDWTLHEHGLRKTPVVLNPVSLYFAAARRWIQVSTVRTGNGRWVCFLVDVSGLKRSEEERARLREQLAVAQKFESVGRLAGGVAHDSNNFIGVILNTSETAMESLDTEHPLHNDLLDIHSAALRCRGIVRQLQAFARTQAIYPVEIDLNAAVEGIWRTLHRLVGETIDLRWRPGPELWPVGIDPIQLDQILANLCINARDAIDGAGWVEVRTANLCRPHGGDLVCLSVRDNGRGMDDYTRGHLFEPYFSTKSPDRGSGLGLATVHGIVTQNGGWIQVDSSPGNGALFQVFLPRFLPPEGGLLWDSTHDDIPRGRGEKVLVVEDERWLCGFIERILRRIGYETRSAHSGEEALALGNFQPDLLLSDVVMPGMDGQSLARELRLRHPALCVIFMSGHDMADACTPPPWPRSDFLEKPFTMGTLAQVMRDLLDQSPPCREDSP